MIFTGWRFEHPKTERSVRVRGWSYFWAGLFGAGYVWWIGHGSVVQALALNILFAIGTVVGVGALVGLRLVAPIYQIFTIAAAVPLIIIVQGHMMVNLIKTGFRRRGYLTRRD
ncbi:MAG TPA: hypothetical protein VMI56_09325 [Reyranella sp.]|nr:hypothetical protein [Reyranella sp.]